MALAFDWNRSHRLLVLAPLFNDGNTFRHQLFEIMRRLSLEGVDCFLPDLPGCNESAQPLDRQTIGHWRRAASAAAAHFRTSHVLALRSSAWLAPDGMPGWIYAPVSPSQTLRTMLRACVIAAREAGVEEGSEGLLAIGRMNGLDLGGWQLGAPLIREMDSNGFDPCASHIVIEHEEIGGAPLWLRAEPDNDSAQAEKIAAMLASGILGA